MHHRNCSISNSIIPNNSLIDPNRALTKLLLYLSDTVSRPTNRRIGLVNSGSRGGRKREGGDILLPRISRVSFSERARIVRQFFCPDTLTRTRSRIHGARSVLSVGIAAHVCAHVGRARSREPRVKKQRERERESS